MTCDQKLATHIINGESSEVSVETDKEVSEVKRADERNWDSAGLESWEMQAHTKPWKQWQETEVCPRRAAKLSR